MLNIYIALHVILGRMVAHFVSCHCKQDHLSLDATYSPVII